MKVQVANLNPHRDAKKNKKREKQMDISAKRLEGETWEDYKARRKAGNRLVKAYLRGRRVKHTKKELRAKIGAITHPLPLPGGE